MFRRILPALASGAALTASALVLTLSARAALACGGCFGAAVTSVDSHRMAVMLSPERSILWDQITYSGAPQDFVWVLPVPSADVDIALASSVFFDELEGQTSPIVVPESQAPPPCFGCCASGSDQAPVGEDGVIVYTEGVVGPYETVVLGSSNGDELQTWLVEHGYPVPESTIPVIQRYVARESVFVVLRLAPGQGVQAMQPVRVTYAGFMARFPLEMVTVGAVGELGMTLWVIAEQRYQPRNYASGRIDPDALVYDAATNSSNYDEVFDATIQDAGGRAWIVEYAGAFDDLWFTDPVEPAEIRAAVPIPFVTRLRTRMLIDHLNEDIELTPASDPTPVPRTLVAPEDHGDEGCSVPSRASAHALFILFLLGSVGWLWRPRRRCR